MTAASVGALIITDRTLNHTLEASSRAWVAPLAPVIEGDIAFPLVVKIPFENTGKSVALNTIHIRDVHVFDVALDASGIPYIELHHGQQFPPV